MGAEQLDRNGRGEPSGIPEFEQPRHEDSDASESMEETGKAILNTFTVERDTGLADGAGAPGSTDVGGMRREKRGDDR